MNATPAASADLLSLHTPSDLVAAVPALLGFHPVESLVAIGLEQIEGSRQIGFLARTNLPGADPPPPTPDQLADYLAGQNCVEAVLVVVGGRSAASPGGLLPHAGLVEQLRRACRTVGVSVRAALWTASVAAGQLWRCYDGCRCAGNLPDPSASELAAASVAAGRMIYPDRTTLERLVAEGEPGMLARRAGLLNDRIDELIEEGGVGAPGGRSAFALVQRWVDRSAAGAPQLTDTDVVTLCLALSDPNVRDACLAFALDQRAEAAECLWRNLVTAAPDPEAAEAAVLLAFSALVRQDGALASVALDRAQRAWPGHRLSLVFVRALHAGYLPEQVVRWCDEGAAQAAKLLVPTGGTADDR